MTQRLRTRVLIIAAVILLMFIVVAPFYYVVTSSFKTPAEIIARTPTLIPNSFTLEHYAKLLRSSPFPIYMLNSVIVALGTMAICVVLSTLAAYGLYRLQLPGSKFLFRVILVTYAFLGVLLLIPLYGMLSSLGLIDRLAALVIVNVTFTAPFAVWMLQAFFTTIPLELEEAAALDGASRLQTLWRVVLILFSFVGRNFIEGLTAGAVK
jgi:multiple sugar transport system permease protein